MESEAHDPYEFNPADHSQPLSGMDHLAETARRMDSIPANAIECVHGIGGILDLIPRDTPSDGWAAVTFGGVGERSPVSEVGALIRRQTLVKMLEDKRVKVSATDIDALVLGCGYALGLMRHMVTHFALCALAQRARGQSPAGAALAIDRVAEGVATVDSDAASLYRFVTKLKERTGEGADSPEERAGMEHRAEIIAGSTLMGQMVAADSALVSLGSSLAELVAREIVAREAAGGEEEL